MMFFQFFIWGSFFVTLADYLGVLFAGRDGISGLIAQIYATNNWAALLAPLFVGLIADRFFSAEKVNGALHLIGAGLLYYCSTIGNDPGKLSWCMLAYWVCYMPTLALVNTVAFRHIESSERDFPQIRLWGTIGWIVAGVVVSESLFGLAKFPVLPGIENAGATSFPMKLGAAVSAIYGLYSFTLPACPPSGRGTPISIAKLLGFDALKMFRDPAFAVFALCSFLICIPLAFYYAMAYPLVNKIGFGDRSGSIMALGQVSEIVFMALVPFFFRKLGVKWMLLVGMLAWTLRYVAFGFAPAMSAPGALLVLGIALHGICYDFFFVTGQLYTDRKAPKEIRASAQGLISLLTYGGGMLVGAYVLGKWGDGLKLDSTTAAGWIADGRAFWLLPAGIALAVAVIFAVSFWDRRADSPDQSS